MCNGSNQGLSGRARETLAALLDHVLRDECSLRVRTGEYHGHVAGPHRYSLHKLFDDQRRQIDFWVRELAQRTRAIGLVVREGWEGRSREAEAPVPPELPAPEMVRDLLQRHEDMSRRLRADAARVGDAPTVDLFQRLAEFHETTAWMLRLLLEGGPGGESEENDFFGAPDAGGRV